MLAAGRCPSAPGLLAEKQRSDRAGQQHDRVQRGQLADWPGPTARHRQLYLRGRKRGRQEAERPGVAHGLR